MLLVTPGAVLFDGDLLLDVGLRNYVVEFQDIDDVTDILLGYVKNSV